MRMQLVAIALFLAIDCAAAAAATVVSAPTGGLWSAGSTWVGGVAPGVGDDVVVSSTVLVDGSRLCHSLEVAAAGVLDGQDGGFNTLSVSDDVLLLGQILDSNLPFKILLGGDLSVGGPCANRETVVTGVGSHHLSMSPDASLACRLTLDPSAPGLLLAETDLRFGGNVDLNGGALRLKPGSDLQLLAGTFTGGAIECDGASIEGGPGSFFDACTIDQAVLTGSVQIGGGVVFTGGLTVLGLFRNTTQFGSLATEITGGLINHGVISNNDYGLTINLSGDLTNNGSILNSMIALDGVGGQAISMGPGSQFDTALLLPEFVPATLAAMTDLSFSNQVALGVGALILEPGHSLILNPHASLRGGVLHSQGNDVFLFDGSWLHGVEVAGNVVLHEVAQVTGATRFAHDVHVVGALRNRQFSAATIEIDGAITNDGSVEDHGAPFTLVLAGDLRNRGDWSNAQVVLRGEQNQRIGAGDGLLTDEFRLESGLGGVGHQWLRDGSPLPGETAPDLVLVGAIGVPRYGAYQCRNSDEEFSRVITVAEFADAVDVAVVEQMFQGATLSNYPEPFTTFTQFNLALPTPRHARLSVHDIAGRQVALLVDRSLRAGAHAIPWSARGLAAGVYFYRFEHDGRIETRRCTLVR